MNTDSGPVVVKAADCDQNRRPILFVHGTYSSGQAIEHMAALLGGNGFWHNAIAASHYDSVAVSAGFTGGGVDSPGVDCTGRSTPPGCGMIDRAIDALLQQFPQFTQIDLAAHSHDGGTEAALPISANGGRGRAGVAEVDGGPCNVIQYTLVHQDHFAVAASKDSFVQVYTYLTGEEPKYTDIQCGDDPVTVEGIAETFADNTPSRGALEVREVGSSPQEAGGPTMMAMDPTGHFGPLSLKRNTQYVFTGHDVTGKVLGWQYFTPFKRDNRLMRILSPASSSDGSPVGGIVAGQSTDHAVTSPLGSGFPSRIGPRVPT